MKQKYFVGGVIISTLIVGTILLYTQTRPSVKEVHYHAGFQVYLDGELEDFSDYKYMSVSPCADDDSYSKRNVDEQNEKAHLHDGNGDVVHTHSEGGTWGDLFRNIRYSIDETKIVGAYINGIQVKDILNYPINSYDSMSIFINKLPPNIETYLVRRVTNVRISEVEKMSEACGIKNKN